MPPQEPSVPSMGPSKTNKGTLVVVLIVVVLLVIAYVLFGRGKSQPATSNNPQPTTNSQNVTKEGVTLKTVNLSVAANDVEKLPAGFPTIIPLETKNITYADSKIYTDRTPQVTLYTIDYWSARSVTQKYNEYLDFMTKNGYFFGTNGKDEKNHALYATTKDNNSLLVVITEVSGKTQVQVNYTKVK